MFFALSKSLAWVASPSAWALLAIAGAILLSRRPRVAAAIATIGAVQLVAFSSPRVVSELHDAFERSVPVTYRPGHRYDAAIVLGGDDARVLGGAELVQSGGGGSFVYTGVLSNRRAAALVDELRSKGLDGSRIVIGDRARNTYENAVEAAEIAAEHGWRSLVVVTNAIHMPRALACFRRQGLEPDAYPIDRDDQRSQGTTRALPGWRPSPAALAQSRDLLHELIGRVVYRALGYSA